MELMQALHTRTSSARLEDPAPDEEQLDAIYKAAMRAPDHAWIRPWRFLVVKGDDRKLSIENQRYGQQNKQCSGIGGKMPQVKLQKRTEGNAPKAVYAAGSETVCSQVYWQDGIEQINCPQNTDRY